MKIYDAFGRLQDWAWLVGTYGPLVIYPAAAGSGWQVVAIREDADTLPENTSVTEQMVAPTVVCTALGRDGEPAARTRVAWYWPDAPEDRAAMPVNGLPVGMRHNRAFSGLTNEEGDVGFAMGGGAYYWPDGGQIGPHACWMYGQNSDVVLGLGMRGGTKHDHLNVTFQYIEEEEEPDWEEIVDKALEGMKKVKALLAAAETGIAEIETVLYGLLEE